MEQLRVVPATPDLEAEMAAVLGEPGEPSHCWCQFHRCTAERWEGRTAGDNRDGLLGLVRDGRVPGLLALDGDDPVGWVAVAPLDDLERLATSPFLPSLRPAGDDLADRWAITCFVVREGSRGRGLLRRLLPRAVDFARGAGASAVEAYPVDPDTEPADLGERLYAGTLTAFRDAGFGEVARLGPHHVLVVRELSG